MHAKRIRCYARAEKTRLLSMECQNIKYEIDHNLYKRNY